MVRGLLRAHQPQRACMLTWFSICSCSAFLFFPPSLSSSSHHPEIRRLFPQAQVQTIPNAGHWIHASHLQDFVAAIRDFLL